MNQMAALNSGANQKGEYKATKVQEEIQQKTNLDYENRLRGHMYQFDETDQTMITHNQNTSNISKGVPSVGSGKVIAHQNIKNESNEGANRGVSMSKDTENMI